MRKIKVVLIGINGFGRYIMTILNRCANIELEGIYDTDINAVEKVSDKYGVKAYYSYEEILKSSCDAVILEVPNSVHGELVRSAADALKHVFVEKPIANEISEAAQMIDFCREKSVLLQVGHSMRYMAKYRKVKELIEENAIGRIVLIEANYSSQRAKKHTKDMWRYSRVTCPGGPMIQLGIHIVDTIYYITGCRPLEVRGLFSDDFTDTYNEDSGAIVMKLEKEIIAYIGSSYVSPQTQSMVIYGDTGKIDIGHDSVVLTINDKSVDVVFPKEDDDMSYIRQFESFADSIIYNRRPEVDGETGLQNLKVITDAIRSSKEKSY